MEEFIQSRQNPRIKALSRLQERSGRRKFNKFAIEGLRELERALEASVAVEELYYCPELFKSAAHSAFIEAQKGRIPMCRLSEQAFERISNREGCDGLLGVAEQWKTSLSEIRLPEGRAPLVLVADAIEKPGNLGALLRSADACGTDAVILSNPVSDIFNPSVIRASQGAVFSVRIAEAEPSEIFAWLKANGIASYAAALTAADFPWKYDLSRPSAVFVGSEKDGLPEDVVLKCDSAIKLPMLGRADSLNVNIAASVILYQAVFQRMGR